MATSSVEGSVLVRAPQDAVWAFLCNARRYPEWIPDTLAILSVDGEPLAAGSAYRERSRLLGPLSLPSDWRVTEFEPPHRQRHDGRMLGPMAVTFEATPEGEGTQFGYRLEWEVPLGPAGRALNAMAMRPRLDRSFRLAAENLCRLVESEAAARTEA